MITCLVTNEKIKNLSQESGLPIEVVKTKIQTWRNQDSKRTEFDYPSVEWIRDQFEQEYNTGTYSEEDNIYLEAVPDVNNRKKDSFLQSLQQSQKIYINENRANVENERIRTTIIGHLKKGKYGELVEFLDKKGILNNINFQLESVDIQRISNGRGGYTYTGPFVQVLKSGERRIYRASYDAQSKTIKINTNALYGDGSADLVLLHEILHHVTVAQIQHTLEFRNAINEIIDAYVKVYPAVAQKYYDEHGLEEFIADVWTDTGLMEDLSNIQATKKFTLWNKLENILKKIYARLFNKDNTLLKQASVLTLDIINNPVLYTGKGTFYESLNNIQPQQVTYEYGGQRRTYTIKGSHIFNDKGQEVFKAGTKNEGSDRIKIFANLAVQQGRAVVVEHKGNSYVVNRDNKIVSVRTGKLMQWGEENGDRRDIVSKAQNKFKELDSARDTSIQYRSTDDLLQRELERDAFRFEKQELEQQDTNNNVLGPETTINIYAGTGENADLSNFAIRPFRHWFSDGAYKDFQSVEQAFQYIKATKFADTRANDGIARGGKSIDAEIMETTDGPKLRNLGRSVKELNIPAWDRASSTVMKELLKESFEQNPRALQRLLATGNATLTHIQDKGKWGIEFPRILMEVRKELEQSNTDNTVQPNQLAIPYANPSAVNVEVSNNLLNEYQNWLQQNPDGIVAFRVRKNSFNTPEAVANGIIGNPFDWQKYGQGVAGDLFLDWLLTGNNHGEEKASSAFRNAIIEKIISSSENTKVLYYTQPTEKIHSHAIILGYLIRNKELLNQSVKQPKQKRTISNGKDVIQLTQEQQNAVDNTLEFIEKKLSGKNTDGKNYITIQGKAGTGKTTIIRNIIKELKTKHPIMKIAVSALSRKAVNLLHNKVKDFGVKKESLYTLAGANYGVSEDEFAINPKKQRFKNYDLVFVDEASMVAPKILEQMDSVSENTIIVFLGDYGQLRPIDKIKGVSDKSKVFSREDIQTATLTERIRQGENSPILSYADKFWDIATGKSNSSVNNVGAEKTIVTPNGALLFNTDNLKVRKRLIEAFREAVKNENPNYIKIIAPFNEQVNEFNNLIHQALFPNQPNLCKGELIIFDSPYTNSLTRTSIDNAEEGVILDVSPIQESTEFNGERFNYITYAIKLSDGTVPTVNVIADKQSMDKQNKYLDELKKKAISTQNPDDWSKYYTQKDKYAHISMSYAITTHKAQGSTYDIAVYEKEQIKTKGNAWGNQGKAENIYTGLTRSRNITMVLEESSDNAFNGSLVELSTNIDQSKGISGFDDDLQTINNEEVVEETNELNISDYILLSGGAYGADTYWDQVGREFGLTNAIHFNPYTTSVRSKTLSSKGIKGTEVNEQNLKRGAEFINSILGENINYKTVAGELIARNFWQVSNSDSVFAIGTFFDDNRTAVTGGTNYAVQLGIKMTDKQRDVYVFDIPTEHWYQYDRTIGKFIKCDTPTLTQKFAGVGTRDIQKYQVYDKNKQTVNNPRYVGDAKSLVAMQAIRDVYEKTFGKTREMLINEQTTALNQEGIPTGMEIKDSEDTVFYATFGNNLKARVNALVRDFQNHTEFLRREKRKELLQESHLPETTEERKNKINKQIRKLKNVDTPLSTIVNIIGIDDVLESVKKGYEERVKNAKTDYAAIENQKIIDNFDRLVEEAVFTFELVLDIKLESKGKEKQVSDVQTEEQETNQEGENSAGYNEITGFNVKQANPYRTTSTIVLNIIKNIKDMKADNTPNQDDLGNELYLDPRYVHTVLKFIMSDCIEPTDFNVQTSTGDWRFPILDKYTSKYKWLTGIKKTLQRNHSYASAFYADLRNDYFQELTLITQNVEQEDGSKISVQKMMPMSEKTERQAAMDELQMNINKHVQLITKPDIQMWDSSGNINRNHLSEILNKVSDITKNLESYMEDEDNNSVYNKIVQLLKAIGFNTNRQSLQSALEVLKEDDDTVATNILLLLENIKSIVGNLIEKEELKDLDIFSLYKSWYSKIADQIGYVSEFNYSSSVRMKDGTALQCFSKPSHYSTVIKKLKNKRKNKEWLNNWALDRKMVYQDSNGEHFYFSWLDLLNDSEGTREELMQQLEHAHMATMQDNNGEVQDYKSWTDDMLYRGFIHMYYSIPSTSGMRYQYAWYNSPILADSPAAIFFKFIKYDDKEGQFEDKMIPLFRNIVKYELNRIDYVRKQNEKGGKQIQNYSKKGLEFQFFPEFNNAIFPINQGTPEETQITLIQGLRNIEESNMSSYEKEQAKNAFIDQGINLILDSYVSRFISDIRDTVKQDIKRDLVQEKVLTEEEAENNEMFERKLKEFYQNNLLAEMNIIHMMGVDPAFYKNPGDFQKRWKEIYASGTKLNTAGQNNTQLAIYLKDDVFRSRVYNHIRFICEKGVKEGKLTKIDEQVILGTFKKVNNSDAQALRSITSYKKILDQQGRWTEDLEETYQRIISGSWNKDDFYTVYQTIKPFLYAIVDEKDSDGNIHHIPHQNKDSEFVLMAMFTMFAGETKDSPKLLGMSRFLEKSGIDTLIFESGVKAGCSNPIDLNYSRIKVTKALQEGKITTPLGEYTFTPVSTGTKGETDFDRILNYFYSQNDKADSFQDMPYSQEEINAIYNALQMDQDEVYDTLIRESGMIKSATGEGYDFNYDVVKVLPTEGYCIVSPTPESLFDRDETDGSQYRNVTIADLNDKFRMEIKGQVFAKKPNIEAGEKNVKDTYNALYVENFLDDYYDVKSIIDVSDEKSLKNFVDRMLDITKGNEKYNRAFREALQLIKDKDGKTVTRLPFCAPQMYKSQELIFSFIKNGLLKQKQTGGASILVSDIGLTDELQVVYEYTDGSGKTISYKEAKKLGINNSNIRLKYIECYMPFYMRSAYRDYVVEKYVESFDEKQGKVVTKKYEELDIERMQKECPELLEAIGYRIPTEDKYSIAPLRIKGFLPVQNGSAIMLASDITALAGCDFDVDKMFLIFREREKIKDKDGKVIKYQAVQYDPSAKPEELSREQRNNFLFDLKWGILTNNETIHIFQNPGNFDVLKKYSKAAYILTHNDIIRSILKNERTYKDKDGKEKKFTDAQIDACTDEVILEIKKMFYSNKEGGLSLDDIEDYINKYEQKRNVASIDTFVYNYIQNMTGKALIGSYANGSSQHQKLQESGLKLNKTKKTQDGNYEDVNFFINGRSISEIDRIDNALGERITKVMANFQAGSVDNVKDPSLANLMQNLNTAGITIFMVRAGFTIDEISLLVNIKPLRDMFLQDKSYNNIDSYIQNLTKLFSEQELSTLNHTSITTSDLIKAILKPYDTNQNNDILGGANTLNTLKCLLFFKEMTLFAKPISALSKIAKADSPTNASSTLAQAQAKMYAVEDFKYKFLVNKSTGKPKRSIISGLGGMIANGANKEWTRDDLRKMILSSKIPMAQAMHTLGTELPLQMISEYLFTQNNAEVREELNYLQYMSSSMLEDKQIEDFYRRLVQAVLVNTELFGDGYGMSYLEKRDYYLNVFPNKFKELLSSNKLFIKKLGVMQMMDVDKRGRIILIKGGKTDPAVEDAYIRNFDELIEDKENTEALQLAKDLLLYAYYYNGFAVDHSSYNQFLSTHFIEQFPEYIEVLRQLENITDRDFMERYSQQYMYNNIDKFAKHVRPSQIKYLKDLQQYQYITEETDETEGLQKPEFISYTRKSNFDGDQYIIYLRHIEGDTYEDVTPIITTLKTQMPIYNPNISIDEINQYIISSRQTQKKQEGGITSDWFYWELDNNTEDNSSVKQQLEGQEKAIESLPDSETQITINRGYKQQEQKKYDEDKSQQSLDKPLCNFADFSDFD